MGSKRQRNKHKNDKPFDIEVSAAEFHELADSMGIDMSSAYHDDDYIAFEPWLLEKVEAAGLMGGLEAADKAGSYEGIVAFLQAHNLADQGGYRDIRKK